MSQNPQPRRLPGGILLICLCSLGTLALLPFLQLGNGTDVPTFALFLGRFHPVILHVPIGLIILAVALEHAHWAGVRRWIPKAPPGTSTFLIFFAAMSALLSTLLGWLLSYSGGYDPALLARHFYAGLATAIGVNLALLLKIFADAKPARRSLTIAYEIVLILTGGCLALAGHYGADITHGEDYLTEYAPNPVRRLLGLPLRLNLADQPVKPLPERVAFAEVVAPILAERCVGCHSGQKAKGGLRLDRYDLVMKGGESGASVIVGEPAKSELLRRIDLPLDNEKHMPPKGKTQPTDDEMAVLNWWIQAGVPDDKRIGELNVPKEVLLAMDRATPEPIREKLDAARREKAQQQQALLTELRKKVPGLIRPLVPGQPELDYSAGMSFADFGDEQLRELAVVGENLVQLDLARTKITDAGLQALAKMPNLAHLELEKTAIGDAGLAFVKTLPKLEVLNLYGTSVTDKGVEMLAGMKTLRRLYLFHTAVTDAEEKRLHKALPKLEIVRKELATAPPVASPSPKGLPSPGKQ